MRNGVAILASLVVLSCAAPAGAQAPAASVALDSAALAWQAGDYIPALERMQRLLRSADGAAVRSRIALLTGEEFESAILSSDARAPRWSPDGRHIAWESGAAGALRTHVMAIDPQTGATRRVAELQGYGAVFAADGATVAWLNVPDDHALTDARAALTDLSGQAAARQRQEVARMEAERARVMVRDLRTGRDREVSAPGMTRGLLAYGADGSLLLVGGSVGAQAS
ncbi:MAG: hypothetical protein L0271_15145, partial [Gemmatimonadetes bacterium]|nr:hypothetical protein [Gemmatimonadota bacterium]